MKATCREVPDIDVREEELVEGKVVKLDLVVKGYKDNIMDVLFTYEMKINELHMKLQPTIPKEV